MAATQAVNSMENAAFSINVSVASVKNSKAQTSFGDLLNSQSVAKTSDKMLETEGYDRSSGSETVNNVKEKLSSDSLKNSTENISKDVEAAGKSSDSGDVTKDVLKTAEEVKEAIKDVLDISEQELTEILEVLGLTVLDLTDRNALMQIVMHVTGTDNLSGLLTNEDASKALKMLFSEVAEILERTGFSAEKFDEAVAAFRMKADDYDMEVVNGEEIPVGQTENGSTVEKAEEGKIFELEVTKTPDTESKEQSTSADSSSGNGFENIAEQFLQKLSQSAQSSQAESTREVFSEHLKEIAIQVVEQVKVNITPEKTTMEMQLNPESLGKVQLSISSKDGVMTAQLLTQNEVAKEAIESQIQVLRESLEKQGIKVEAIEVTIAQFGFEQNTQTGREDSGRNEGAAQRRNGRSILADLEPEVPEEMIAVADPEIFSSGSSVDYSA